MNFRSKHRKYSPTLQLPILAFSTTDHISLSSMQLLTSVVIAPLPHFFVGVLTVRASTVRVLPVEAMLLSRTVLAYWKLILSCLRTTDRFHSHVGLSTPFIDWLFHVLCLLAWSYFSHKINTFDGYLFQKCCMLVQNY